MVWYDILEHLIVHFSFSCWLYNERHFLTGSGLKVLHPNFQKGSGIFTFHDERLAFFVCLFKFSPCFFFHSMELPLHFLQHLQDSPPHTGRAPLRIDEMSDRRDSESGPDLQSLNSL